MSVTVESLINWLFSWRPLAFGAVVYALMVAAYVLKDRPGMALCFVGYVIGNIGLIWDYVRTSS